MGTPQHTGIPLIDGILVSDIGILRRRLKQRTTILEIMMKTDLCGNSPKYGYSFNYNGILVSHSKWFGETIGGRHWFKVVAFRGRTTMSDRR